MTRGSIISSAKAIRQQQAPATTPQGYGGSYVGSVSPMARQLDTGGSQDAAWTNAYRSYLPRPAQDFTNGAFGPFNPILPVPVDAPEPGSDFPDARLWQYEVGWNMPVGQPGSEGLKLTDFGTLKSLADLYSVARACIQLRKNEIRGIDWDIMPTPDAAKSLRGSKDDVKDFAERRAEAMKFFMNGPDPDYFSWDTFLDALLEEVFVFDALSLVFRRKWDKSSKKGLLGSNLDSLSLINGPTIRPLVDMMGAKPRPPAPAYQQYLYGVPRSDFMTLITERDIKDGGLTGSEINNWRANQMLYLPMNPRRWTPYGFPPVERALVPVMSGLQKQGYQLDYFREGCCDDQTEILTQSGWKLFKDLTDTDEVATRSPSGEFEWQLPTERQTFRVDDELVHFTSKAVDMMLTKNHRMLVRRTPGYIERHPQADYQDWGIVPAEYLAKRPAAQFEVPAVPDSWKGTWHPQEFISYPKLGKGAPGKPGEELVGTEYRQDIDTFSEFLGLFIAEGWVNSRDGAICVSQAEHNADFAEVTSILDVMELNWRYLPDHRRFYTYHAGLARWLKENVGQGAASKRIPAQFKELDRQGLEHVLHGLVTGDGHYMKKARGVDGVNGLHYTTVSRILADDVMEILQKLGRDSRILKRTPPAGSIGGRALKSQRDIYEVYERLAKTHNIAGTAKKMVEYHGNVYCVTVPNSIILVRRNGQPVWTGNTVPAVYISPGGVNSNMTPNQIRELQDALNAIAGDPAWKHKIIVLPADSKVMPQRQQELADAFDEVVMNQVCMSFDVQPMELGILPKVSTTTSPGASRQMAKMTQDVQERKATKPTLTFIQDIMDYILQQVCGQEDMRFVFAGMQEEKDEEVLTKLLVAQIGAGIRSIDEARDQLKLQPWGLPETSDPGWATPQGWFPLQEAVEALRTGSVTGPVFSGVEEGPGGNGAATPSLATQEQLKPGSSITGAPAAPGQAPASNQQTAKPATKKAAPAKPASKPRVKPTTSPLSGRAANRPGTGTSAKEPTPAHTVASANSRRKTKSYSEDADPAIEAEFQALARHMRKGREISTWEPKHIDQGILARIAEHVAKGLDPDTAIDVSRRMRRVMDNGEVLWVDEDPDEPESWDNPAGGGGFEKFPHDAEGLQYAAKSEASIPAHPTVSAEVVYRQMLKNFPPEALGWIKRARWTGPVSVPHSLINLSDEDTWAAHHEQEKVDSFAERIQEGDLPKPSVAVLEPGSTQVKIIDGHHRALAYLSLGLPVRMYIGRTHHHDGPWDETHSFQMHQGADPQNKSEKVSKASVNYRDTESTVRNCGSCSMFRAPHGCTLVAGLIRAEDVCDAWEPAGGGSDAARKGWGPNTPQAAGIAVRAADTGRVLMIQRAMSDDDPAAGTWEFPGGCLENSESPVMGAVREWQEETGMHLPPGRMTGRWLSSNGVYRGIVYEILSEGDLDIGEDRDQITNPDDPDGDQFESLAWWSPEQLAENPAIRTELLADLDRVLEALKVDNATKAAVLSKAARQGNPGALRRWFEEGAGGRIDWGAPGDFDACVAVASEHMSEEQARGFCQRRHIGALGIATATHAAEERHGS